MALHSVIGSFGLSNSCEATDNTVLSGGYWELCKRGQAEMNMIPTVWTDFLSNFEVPLQESNLLDRSAIVALGDRLVSIGEWVADRVAERDADDQFQTIVHGDFKVVS